ncbi:MAG: hypothetical protein DRP65_00880 [Planctomycetota bacterium]|nr:MAG: hypothetical protein DRP65_00880 [Planctomycetota bacterium]
MDIPIIELVAEGIKCRIPLSKQGKIFSLVNIGICNFNCLYCCKGGNAKTKSSHLLPCANYIGIDDIYSFIDQQTQEGHLIKISGGEPTLIWPDILDIMSYCKKNKVYVSCDTSGWNTERSIAVAEIADQMAIDLKGPPKYVSKITQTSLELCWTNVIKSIETWAKITTLLEIRTPIFNFTTLDDLTLLAQYIPQKAFWVLRRFITSEEDSNIFLSHNKYPDWLISPEHSFVNALATELLNIFPDLYGRIILLQENPRSTYGEIIY